MRGLYNISDLVVKNEQNIEAKYKDTFVYVLFPKAPKIRLSVDVDPSVDPNW